MLTVNVGHGFSRNFPEDVSSEDAGIRLAWGYKNGEELSFPEPGAWGSYQAQARTYFLRALGGGTKVYSVHPTTGVESQAERTAHLMNALLEYQRDGFKIIRVCSTQESVIIEYLPEGLYR